MQGPLLLDHLADHSCAMCCMYVSSILAKRRSRPIRVLTDIQLIDFRENFRRKFASEVCLPCSFGLDHVGHTLQWRRNHSELIHWYWEVLSFVALVGVLKAVQPGEQEAEIDFAEPEEGHDTTELTTIIVKNFRRPFPVPEVILHL